MTIGITVTFMFHSFFNCLARSRVLIFLFVFFQFNSVVSGDSKVYNLASLLLLLGRLAEIRGSVFISKSQKGLSVSFSSTDSVLCIYHLSVWSKLNFLHSSQGITLPIQPCIVLYSFCASLPAFAYYMIGRFVSITT